MATELQAITERIDLLESKVAALEEIINALPAAAEPAKAKPEPVQLLGTPFKVGGKQYRLRYPKFVHEGRNYTEADVLGDKALQEALVNGGIKVVEAIA